MMHNVNIGDYDMTMLIQVSQDVDNNNQETARLYRAASSRPNLISGLIVENQKADMDILFALRDFAKALNIKFSVVDK